MLQKGVAIGAVLLVVLGIAVITPKTGLVAVNDGFYRESLRQVALAAENYSFENQNARLQQAVSCNDSKVMGNALPLGERAEIWRCQVKQDNYRSYAYLQTKAGLYYYYDSHHVVLKGRNWKPHLP